MCVVESSKDLTNFEAIVAKFGQLSNLTIVRSSPPGVSRARNAALEACETPYIAQLDDDAVPEPRWIESLTRAFHDHGPSVVAGTIHPDWPGPEPEWLPPKHAPCRTILDYGKEDHGLPGEEFAYGANMAFKVEALRKMGGINVVMGRRGLKTPECRGYRSAYPAEATWSPHVVCGRCERYAQGPRQRADPQLVSFEDDMASGFQSLVQRADRSFRRSSHEIRNVAEKLGSSELVARLVEPVNRQVLSTQLDLIYHHFVRILASKNLDDDLFEDALWANGLAQINTSDNFIP